MPFHGACVPAGLVNGSSHLIPPYIARRGPYWEADDAAPVPLRVSFETFMGVYWEFSAKMMEAGS